MRKFVTIIIPVINNSQLTLQCIDSIFKNTSKEINAEIIIVDNGSNENELKALRAEKRINLIELTTNHGFGSAINTAVITRVDDSDVIVLNNDTIVTKDWIKKLQDVTYSKDEYGVVGPVLLYENNTIQSSGGFLTSKGWGDHNRDYPKSNRTVEYAPAACIYVKNELITKLGNRIFDETFFPAYSEDVYLGYEAREKGYESIITPEIAIYHLEGMTSKNNSLNDNEKRELNKAKLVNREKLYKKIESVDYTKDKKHKVAFIGASQGGWSYASVLRNLTKALDKTDEVDVAIYDPNYHQYMAEPDWEISKLRKKNKDFTNRISIRYSEGNLMFLSFGDKKIGYTTHESITEVPKDWVYQLNQLDQVWTTAEFVKKVLIQSGVTKPIYVIPHGINFDLYNPFGKKAKLSYTKGFIFYVNNIYGPRKNIDYIIKAYTEEFNSDEDVTLLMKCNFNDMLKPNKPINYFAQFQRNDGMTPKVELINNWVKEDMLPLFYRKADCFIGIGNEGYGLTNIESMACGVPCIAPSWGGLTEFCNEENSLILKKAYKIPARQDFLFSQYANTHWAVPDINELRKTMRFAYENQEFVKELGKKAYNSVSHMSWDWVADKCVKAIEKI